MTDKEIIETKEHSPWRFCVAPMMDWTDSEKSMLYVNRLQWCEATCRNNVVVARARACGEKP
jgi:hypothetical protein